MQSPEEIDKTHGPDDVFDDILDRVKMEDPSNALGKAGGQVGGCPAAESVNWYLWRNSMGSLLLVVGLLRLEQAARPRLKDDLPDESAPRRPSSGDALYVQFGENTIEGRASAAGNGEHDPLVLPNPAHLFVRVAVCLSVGSCGVSSKQRTPLVVWLVNRLWLHLSGGWVPLFVNDTRY